MNNYTKHAGMAFELLVLILMMVFFGKKVDAWLKLEKPIMVVLFVCFGMIGYIVKLYYQTNKKSIDEK